MSSVPVGKGLPTRSDRRAGRRLARGAPRVRMPVENRCARSFWRSATSCAIRSTIRRIRSASRIRVFLTRVSVTAKARAVYELGLDASTDVLSENPPSPSPPVAPSGTGRGDWVTGRRGEEKGERRQGERLQWIKTMVVYNAGTRELTAKIVYYGPGLGGKTTNLQVLHDRLDPATVGKLLNLATQTDRTIYFDLLPVELGDIKGYKIRFQLATVPGQTAFNETRRVVLKGADGIVFVADSQWTMLPKNLESWHNLKENLKANGVSFEGIPIVIQYNKRDLTDILSVDALQEALGLSSYPFVEAVASAGRGVTETFKLISKLTFVDLLRRLQGRRPEEAAPLPPRKDKDDLLSWKDSLLNRATPAAVKRPLSLLPPAETREEAPFGPPGDALVQEASAEMDGPFTEASAPQPQPETAPAD